jgi:hypothetical protein
VALTAVLTILILVRIFMTACTVAVLNSAELLIFFPVRDYNFMAFNAIHFFMLPGKLESGICMTKF